MRARSSVGWSGAAGVCGALLLAVAAPPASAEPPRAVAAAHSWANGDVAATLEALRSAQRSRETELNSAVVRLYAGEATEAAAALAALRARHPGWTPASRWLARAQATLGVPEALDSADALIARPEADALDRLWAGNLFLIHDRPQQAQAAFDAVRRWNRALPVEWQRPLDARAAPRTVANRTASLWRCATSSSEHLRYEVKYLLFHLATVTLDTGPLELDGGELARRVVFTAKSSGVPFFHIDSRFESAVDAGGTVLAHRHVANDSDAGADEAGYDMDRRNGRCTVRMARNGLLSYHVLPLPEHAQDGVSVLLAAREVGRRRGSAVLPTAVDGLWWPTELRTVGTETIRWAGRERATVHVRCLGGYRGAAGVTGPVDIWLSDDERALPYKVKMKVAVGSVVLELADDETFKAARNEVKP